MGHRAARPVEGVRGDQSRRRCRRPTGAQARRSARAHPRRVRSSTASAARRSSTVSHEAGCAGLAARRLSVGTSSTSAQRRAAIEHEAEAKTLAIDNPGAAADEGPARAEVEQRPRPFPASTVKCWQGQRPGRKSRAAELPPRTRTAEERSDAREFADRPPIEDDGSNSRGIQAPSRVQRNDVSILLEWVRRVERVPFTSARAAKHLTPLGFTA